MPPGNQFRRILPIAQTALALTFGGWGVRQRDEILSRSWLGWNSTARFHVWPWPLKFAAVSNMPAFLGGAFVSWPMSAVWPRSPEWAQLAPSLLFVMILWDWIGARLDRRWGVADKAPWLALLIFTLVCLVGAFIRIGYTGYLPYGVLVWLMTTVAISLSSRTSSNVS